MNLKTRLITGTSALVLVTGLIGVAAPAAHAAPTVIGGCSGGLSVADFGANPANQLDNTDSPRVEHTTPALDWSSAAIPKPKQLPTCTVGGGPLPVINQVSALSGYASCNPAASPPPPPAIPIPLHGKLTLVHTTTPPPPASSAYVSVLGIGKNGHYADVIDLGGILITGALAGADVSGSFWENPSNAMGPYKTNATASTTNGSTHVTITGAPTFTAADVGGTISGPGIPPGSHIVSRDSAPPASAPAHGVTIDNPATATASGVTITVNAGLSNSRQDPSLALAGGCQGGANKVRYVLVGDDTSPF